MRISTNTIYQSGISKISDIQVEQSKLQQQIATGRRILTPSDDPVGSARALQLTQSQKSARNTPTTEAQRKPN